MKRLTTLACAALLALGVALNGYAADMTPAAPKAAGFYITLKNPLS